MNLLAYDFFAGCGGLSKGLENAGVNVLWANESDEHAAQSYRASHPNTEIIVDDANVLLHRFINGSRSLPKPGEVDLVVGGPPCQGFSGFNRNRRLDDPRNSLIETFLGFITYLNPKYVLMENVPGLLSLGNGSALNAILSELKDLDFTTSLGILQAGHYGVPQNRWRVFIWGAKPGHNLPMFPAPTHEFPRKTVFGATSHREFIIKAPVNGDGSLHPLLPTVTKS
jgi:DNA (cytosine-5)-methyltransferase 1|tara:strand:+ start:711 stop:1388 length:678 start_codon:yes stop_codon:yes gene_type:complete